LQPALGARSGALHGHVPIKRALADYLASDRSVERVQCDGANYRINTGRHPRSDDTPKVARGRPGLMTARTAASS